MEGAGRKAPGLLPGERFCLERGFVFMRHWAASPGAAILVFGLVLPASAASDAAAKVKHVVVLIQENRSFDNLFNGFPGADTVPYGYGHNGQKISLAPAPLEQLFDPDHSHAAWLTESNGGAMNGFDREKTFPKTHHPYPAYEYIEHSEIQPYFRIGERYGIADRMFASQTGPSYAGHQYIVAAQSHDLIGDPTDPLGRWGCDAQPGTTTEEILPNGKDILKGPFPCFNYATLGDLLDQAHVTWKYYANLGTEQGVADVLPDPYDAIRHIRFGPDWEKRTVTPSVQILLDIPLGNLAAVSWVNPPFVASDHPLSNLGLGPQWVGNIVNEIESSQYAKDTVILIVWDDWGGFYDHVLPRVKDQMGLGFRVPLLVVSPYAKQGYVSHVEHEYGSLAHFIESVYGLPSLGQRDANSDDLSDFFNFGMEPRPRAPIETTVPPSVFLQLPPDTQGDY
jgi:phospholipase C